MRTPIQKHLCIAILLLPVFTGRLQAQHILDFQIDSLQKLAAKAPPDTGKVNIYLELARNYYTRYALQGSQPADSLAFVNTTQVCRSLSEKLHYVNGIGHGLLWESYFSHFLKNESKRDERLQQAFAVFRASANKAGESKAYFVQAEMRPVSDTSTQRLNLYDTAVKLARKAGDAVKEVNALKGIAHLHILQGKYSLAIQELLNLLDQQKRMNDKRIHFTTDLLSHAFATIGNHKESLRYAIASLQYSRLYSDTALIVTFYQRLANNYATLRNYDKAFYYYDKALSSFIPGNLQVVTSLSLNILCHMTGCLINQKKYQQAFDFLTDRLKKYSGNDELSKVRSSSEYLDLYYYTGRYKEAEECLLNKFQNHEEADFLENNQLFLFTRAGQLYFQLRQFDKAARYSDSAYSMAIRLNSRHYLMENNLTLYKLDSIKGNYLSAIRHYQQYKNYSDTIQSDISNRQAAELAVQYETDQKNSELQLLTDRAQLQQLAIKQGISVRNTMIAGSGLLLLLLFVIFNRYRLKQKANALLQEKQDEINRQNQVLEKMIKDEKKITGEKDKLLTEKGWLMKEINHRVKNNLQVVMGLLDTQRAYLKDEAALNAIQESQHRVHAISLIHQKLYQTELQLTVINMGPYIREVTEYLTQSISSGSCISSSLNIDAVELDVAQAVPVGLIINEAITNSVKYAFPNGRKGQIHICMRKIPACGIELTVSDNGIGLPPDFDWQHTRSLGMSLMRGLSKQLDGTLELASVNGLAIKLHFEPVKILNQ